MVNWGTLLTTDPVPMTYVVAKYGTVVFKCRELNSLEVTHYRGGTFCFNLFLFKYIFLYKRSTTLNRMLRSTRKEFDCRPSNTHLLCRVKPMFQRLYYGHLMFDAKNAILIYCWDLAILRHCMLKCSFSLSRFAFHFLSYLTVYPGGPMSSF